MPKKIYIKFSFNQSLALQIFCATLFLALLALSILFDVSGEVAALIFPSLVALLNFSIFSTILLKRVGDNLFGEIGFIYCGFLVLYTLIPAFNFINGNFGPADPISILQASSSDITLQLWRQELFIFAFTTGYLLLRGQRIVGKISDYLIYQDNQRTIIFLFSILLIILYFLIILSSGVDNYYESYMRYENLNFISRKLVSIAIRFKEAIYSALLTFLFMNYRKYSIHIIFIIIGC